MNLKVVFYLPCQISNGNFHLNSFILDFDEFFFSVCWSLNSLSFASAIKTSINCSAVYRVNIWNYSFSLNWILIKMHCFVHFLFALVNCNLQFAFQWIQRSSVFTIVIWWQRSAATLCLVSNVFYFFYFVLAWMFRIGIFNIKHRLFCSFTLYQVVKKTPSPTHTHGCCESQSWNVQIRYILLLPEFVYVHIIG